MRRMKAPGGISFLGILPLGVLCIGVQADVKRGVKGGRRSRATGLFTFTFALP
jgi:hypothetical protein